MSERQVSLRFLLDEGAPDPVGEMLRRHGHTVIFHREVCASGVDDDIVCEAALKNEAILIAVDGDMKSKPKRYGAPTSPRFAKLSLIRICCKEPLAEARLEQALDLVILEWN